MLYWILGLHQVAHKVVTSSHFQSPQICSLKGEKTDFLPAIVKKYSSCRIEVVLYEIFTIKYQKVSIKIILTEVNHKFYFFNSFFALKILFWHIYIILYMNYKFTERLLCDLYRIKKINLKKFDQTVNYNFCLLCNFGSFIN